MTTTKSPTVQQIDGLRRWARGSRADEAAVELLIGMGLRFARPGCPWVKPCRRAGWYWLDADELSGYTGHLTPRQRRVFALMTHLLEGTPGLAAVAADVSELGRAA